MHTACSHACHLSPSTSYAHHMHAKYAPTPYAHPLRIMPAPCAHRVRTICAPYMSHMHPICTPCSPYAPHAHRVRAICVPHAHHVLCTRDICTSDAHHSEPYACDTQAICVQRAPHDERRVRATCTPFSRHICTPYLHHMLHHMRATSRARQTRATCTIARAIYAPYAHHMHTSTPFAHHMRVMCKRTRCTPYVRILRNQIKPKST
jgi:hypothetical protein